MSNSKSSQHHYLNTNQTHNLGFSNFNKLFTCYMSSQQLSISRGFGENISPSVGVDWDKWWGVERWWQHGRNSESLASRIHAAWTRTSFRDYERITSTIHVDDATEPTNVYGACCGIQGSWLSGWETHCGIGGGDVYPLRTGARLEHM